MLFRGMWIVKLSHTILHCFLRAIGFLHIVVLKSIGVCTFLQNYIQKANTYGFFKLLPSSKLKQKGKATLRQQNASTRQQLQNQSDVSL